jgi:hypothetical protein
MIAAQIVDVSRKYDDHLNLRLSRTASLLRESHFFNLGSLIKYIPIGFTSGIAVIIFSGQIASFLGLTGIEKHEDSYLI